MSRLRDNNGSLLLATIVPIVGDGRMSYMIKEERSSSCSPERAVHKENRFRYVEAAFHFEGIINGKTGNHTRSQEGARQVLPAGAAQPREGG